MTEVSLTAIAEALGVDREEVLKGFDLRRQDYVLGKAAQQKAAQLRQFLQVERELA
jgi:hypothetical protein